MTENIENNGCSQRDSAEHEGYAKASRSFNRIWKERDSAQSRLLEVILYKENFNRAYKRVKANKGAPGIDGMTIEEALPYLKEHQQELTDRIYRGKYTPSPVRRVEIPKPDGGVRKLGISIQKPGTGEDFIIDCDRQDIYLRNGRVNKNNDFVLSNGEFFELKPGRNKIQCTGLYLNRVWITPNWWTV